MKKSFIFYALIVMVILSACSNTFAEDDSVYYPIGDSITWLDGNEYAGTDEVAVGYPSIIKEKIEFDGIINKGVDGGSLAKNSNYPVNGSILLDNNWDDINLADLITILAGTNDFKLGVPLGEIVENNYDESTFTGAYQSLLDKINEENPNAAVYLITPLQRDNDNYDINIVNDVGHKLVDYVDRIKELSDKYGYEVIDLYGDSKITVDTLDDYTVDGLHPNDKGFEVMANEIMDAVNY